MNRQFRRYVEVLQQSKGLQPLFHRREDADTLSLCSQSTNQSLLITPLYLNRQLREPTLDAHLVARGLRVAPEASFLPLQSPLRISMLAYEQKPWWAIFQLF
jgi:hypothetical protein